MEENILNDNILEINEFLAIHREISRQIKIRSRDMKPNTSFLVPIDLLYQRDGKDYDKNNSLIKRVKALLPKNNKKYSFKAILVTTGVRVFKIHRKDDPLYSKPSPRS